jgi:hypothetical protein
VRPILQSSDTAQPGVSLDSRNLHIGRMEGDVKHLTMGAGVCLLLCAGATRVEGQGVASSFDQLTVLVKPGDKVTVVEVTGRESSGRIGTLSRDALILVTSDGPRQLSEVEVASISQRRGDSLKNGAIIGAVAGAGYFLTAVAIFSTIEDDGDIIMPAAVVSGLTCAGLGAAIGVGIDALISRRQAIFQKPAGGSRISASPVLGRGRRGMAVTVEF